MQIPPEMVRKSPYVDKKAMNPVPVIKIADINCWFPKIG